MGEANAKTSLDKVDRKKETKYGHVINTKERTKQPHGGPRKTPAIRETPFLAEWLTSHSNHRRW